MPPRAHLPVDERQALSRLRQLLSKPGLLHGSLRVNRRACGKKNCRCAQGELHSSLTLWVVDQGRQIPLHVPAAWQERVQEWVERDREIRSLLLKLSALYTARLRERKE